MMTAEYRLEKWAQIMRDRQESGLSIKAYCHQMGIHTNTFFYWQRKLRMIAYEQLTTTQLAPGGFTRVNIIEPYGVTSAPSDTKIQRDSIHIDITTMKITAEAGYPASQLADLIKGLMSR